MATGVGEIASQMSTRTRIGVALLIIAAAGSCTYALVLSDSRGEIIVGAVALFVTLFAIGLAVLEIRSAVERGRLERLWALEARWMSMEVCVARVEADLLLKRLRRGPEDPLQAYRNMERSEKAAPRVLLRQVQMVLNVVEEFAEAAHRDYADQDRLRLNYARVFKTYREQWAFVIEEHLQATNRLDPDGYPDPTGRSFGYLDNEARRAGYSDPPAGNSGSE